MPKASSAAIEIKEQFEIISRAIERVVQIVYSTYRSIANLVATPMFSTNIIMDRIKINK